MVFRFKGAITANPICFPASLLVGGVPTTLFATVNHVAILHAYRMKYRPGVYMQTYTCVRMDNKFRLHTSLRGAFLCVSDCNPSRSIATPSFRRLVVLIVVLRSHADVCLTYTYICRRLLVGTQIKISKYLAVFSFAIDISKGTSRVDTKCSQCK